MAAAKPKIQPPAAAAQAKVHPVPAERRVPSSAGAAAILLPGIAALMALMLFAFPTFVLLAAGMAPTFVAIMVDNQRNPDRLHTIAGCNFAGALPYLVTLWVGSNDLSHALHLLQDVYVWAAMYLGAAAGMAALWLGPHLAATLYGFRAVRRRRELESYRRALIEEWGSDVIPPGELAEDADKGREQAA